MNLNSLFSESDRDVIREATKRAEGQTSGEIVPVVVGECDDYDEAAWKTATLGALLTAMAVGVFELFAGHWGGMGILWITLPSIAGAAAGFLLARAWPGLRRALISDETIDLRVMRRAHQAFLEEEVFATRDRTGILVFLAMFEHRVVVLGDEAINRAVEEAEWQGVVDLLVDGIRSQRPAEALIQAIGECGRLLEVHGVEIQPDDTDELRDGVRLEER